MRPAERNARRWKRSVFCSVNMRFPKANQMNTFQRATAAAIVTTMLLGLDACSGMSRQDKNTAIGAGAVGGAELTGGSAAGTAAGAVVGGVIGHEVKKD